MSSGTPSNAHGGHAMGSQSSGSTTDFVFYHYAPSLAAAAVFLAVFGLSTIVHCYQCVRGRAWYMVPLILGGLCETVGYVGRIINSKEAPDYQLGPYIIQSLLLLVAPALLAASVYMVLGRIVTAVHGEEHCPMPKRYMTLTFVTGDFISFMIQSTGAGLAAKPEPDSQAAGKWIVVGGLVIQLIFFGLFIVVSYTFYGRIHKSPTAYSQSHAIHWRRVIRTLYAASILIMVRSVFRVVEYVQGNDGYLLRNENWLYIFDATLMAGVMLMFNLIHPKLISTIATGEDAEAVGAKESLSHGESRYPQGHSTRGTNIV